MYYQHFGLNGPPFQFAPSPEILYMSQSHREGLATLEWGVLYEPAGFTLLTGETGTGKTTLICSILVRKLDQVSAAYVIHPKLSFNEMLRVIMKQLGIAAGPGCSKLDSVEAINGLVANLKPGGRVAIIVDEAQDLSDDTLEEFRLLSNYRHSEGRQIQLIMIGQPELAERLQAPTLRQINQRIAARAVLNPLAAKEAPEYVEYRLRAKRGHAANVFASDALDYLCRHSAGIPRRINVLCHNAMLLAYSAGAKRVDLKTAKIAVADYEGPGTGRKQARRRSSKISPRAGLRRSLRLVAPIIGLAALAMMAGGVTYEVTAHRIALPAGKTVSGNRTTDAEHLTATALKQLTTATDAIAAAPAKATAHPIPAVQPSAGSAPASAVPAGLSIAVPSSSTTGQGDLAMTPDVASPTRFLSPRTDTRRIRVRYGDTLEKIAVRYFGAIEAINDLIDANPQLTNINRLYVGEILYLPALGTVAKNSGR